MAGLASLLVRTEYICGTENSIMSEEQEHLTKTEARAGSTPGVARNVLTYGLVLVIAMFALILFINR
jgi:hypothetical protein